MAIFHTSVGTWDGPGDPGNPWGWLEIAKRIAATAAEIIVNDLIGEISLNAKQHTIDLES